LLEREHNREKGGIGEEREREKEREREGRTRVVCMEERPCKTLTG